MRGIIISEKKVIMITLKQLMINPALTISIILTLFEPKIMALGAVAAGNIKAQLAAKVAGIIIDKGWRPLDLATLAKMGRSISVEDILLVSSVKKLMPKVRPDTTKTGEISANPINLAPITPERPEIWIPLAKANPPPKSNIVDQGISSIASFPRIFSPFLAGIIKRRRAIITATVPSSIL